MSTWRPVCVSHSVLVHAFHVLCQSTCFIFCVSSLFHLLCQPMLFMFCVSPRVSSSVSVHAFHVLCQSMCFIFCISPWVSSSVSAHAFHLLCQPMRFISCVSPCFSSSVSVHAFHLLCQSTCLMLRTTDQTLIQVRTHRYIKCNIHLEYSHYSYVILYH